MTYKEKENLLKIQRRDVFQSRFSAKDDAGFAGGADYRRSPARGNKEICQIKHIVIQIQMY